MPALKLVSDRRRATSANEKTKQISPHYDEALQPWDVILAWKMGFLDGNALKYLQRWNKKGTPLQDLEKAKHYIEKLIEQVQRQQEAGARQRPGRPRRAR